MCTPVGHGLAGIALSWRGSRRLDFRPAVWMPALCVLSVLPDLDFLPGILIGRPNVFHHGWTHSIVFCLAAAALIAAGLSAAGKPRPAATAGLCLLVLLSHLALDCLSKDRLPPRGLQLFWPFSERYVMSPIAVFLDVNKGVDNGTFLLRLATFHNVKTMLLETVLLGPLAAWAWFGNRRRKREAAA